MEELTFCGTGRFPCHLNQARQLLELLQQMRHVRLALVAHGPHNDRAISGFREPVVRMRSQTALWIMLVHRKPLINQ